MSSRSSETVPFWAASSLVRESNGPQGRVISMDGMESWTGKLTGAESDSTASGTPFQRGDVLFGKLRPYLAKSWLADESGTAQGDIHVYRPHASTHPKYLAYIIRSREFVHFANAASEGVKMPRVEWTKLRSYDIPLPDLPTQRRIADYLDRETAQIDAMAGALDGLVARLEERRRSVITDIVDSADYPRAHIGGFCELTSGSGFPVKYQGRTDERYPFFKVGSLSRLDPKGFVNDQDNTISRETASLLGATIIPSGSILLAKIGMAMLLGRFVRTATECCIDNNMLAVTPRPDVSDAAYVQYALRLAPVRLFINPGPVPSMNVTSLRMHSIPLPPLEEQRRIADHLDAETAKIDAMIAKAGKLRALLEERRSALITATVTGQHPVPEEP